MQAKPKPRQFKGTSKTRLFFDRLVREQGNTRSLSLGKVIPDMWSYVRIEVIDREADSITLKISKLLETTPDAQNNTAHKGCEQNT